MAGSIIVKLEGGSEGGVDLVSKWAKRAMVNAENTVRPKRNRRRRTSATASDLIRGQRLHHPICDGPSMIFQTGPTQRQRGD